MRVTDRDILKAIQTYRDQVGDRHGPPSLEVLSGLIGQDGDTLSKGGLSLRIKSLLTRRLLYGLPVDSGTPALTLALTDKGLSLLNGEDDGE